MPMHDDPMETFREEAQELLADLEESLLGLEDDPEDRELIDAAFRSLHTIKGSGTMFDLPALVNFAHSVEAVFDRVRTGAISLTPNLISLALRAKDHLEALLFTPEAAGLHEHGNELLAVLERVVPAGGAPSAGGAPPAAAELPADAAEPDPPPPTPVPTPTPGRPVHITFAPPRDYFRTGGNPLAIFEELRDLGDVELSGSLDAVPPVGELEPDGCYLRWEITLTTHAPLTEVAECFMFVPDAVTIREHGAEPAPEDAAVPETLPAAGDESRRDSHIAVPAAKLDELVHLAGEFVSAHAHLLHLAETRNDGDVLSAGAALGELVRGLRELSNDLQLVPLSSAEARLNRAVREAAQTPAKTVAFHLNGGDTQIDKHLLDDLKSSLVPVLHHVVDEELASEAQAATIRLTARHTDAHVLLELVDNGSGTALAARSADMRHALARLRHTAERAGGSATVSPVAGEGTTVSLRIPVSVSVVEGLLTQVGDTRYMIRLSEIERCVDMRSVQRVPGQDMIDLGGEAVPVRDVRTLFGAEPQGDETQVVVVAGESGRMGLLVDQVFDTHQAVVKPLGRMLHGVVGIGGTMILGDGTPAMLLDVAAL